MPASSDYSRHSRSWKSSDGLDIMLASNFLVKGGYVFAEFFAITIQRRRCELFNLADLGERVAEQIFDNARIAAGLLEDPRAMLTRLNNLLEKALTKDCLNSRTSCRKDNAHSKTYYILVCEKLCEQV
jgi:hypothetical protein